jgi:hypothetical protein
MSDSSRSFWSSIPGFITGLAGLLTGIVGLVTVALQLGWIGGKSSSDADKTTTTVAVSTVPGQTTSGAGQGFSTTVTTGTGAFTVDPASLDFAALGPKELTVTVKNTSAAVPLTVQVPEFTGTDASRFQATDVSCTKGPLEPNRTCQLKVTFAPTGTLRNYSATMVVSARGAARAVEVSVKGSTLVG